MESRIIQRVDSRLERPAENQAPISPGIRHSSQASRTWEDEFDKLKIATKCKLVICIGTVPVTVAKGLVHPRPTHMQLRHTNALVEVDLVVGEWSHTPLPVPTEMMFSLDDARASSMQWPKSQIILDEKSHLYSSVHTERELVVATDPVHTERQLVVTTDALGSTKGSLVTAQEYSLLPPACRRLHDKLITRPDMADLVIMIEIPPDMFLHDGSQRVLSLEDFQRFFSCLG